MTRARTVLALLVAAGLVLALGSLPWTRATLADPLAGTDVVESAGGGVAPLAPALALVTLAAAGAASIARRAGALAALAVAALAGAGVLAVVVGVLTDPAVAAAADVGEALGITASSVRPEDAAVAVTPWPWLTLVAGAGVLAAALAGMSGVRRWSSGRRFEASAAGQEAPGGAAPAAGTEDAAHARSRRRAQAFDSWDALSRGEDPTDAPGADTGRAARSGEDLPGMMGGTHDARAGQDAASAPARREARNSDGAA